MNKGGLLLGGLLFFNVQAVSAADFIVDVVRIIDGDTFTINLPLPPPLNKGSVRIKGIDTPESGSKAKCKQEAEQAKKATASLKSMLTGKSVILRNVEWDKYGGRITANVFINDHDVGEEMLASKLALPYTGHGRKPNWCAFLPQ